MVSTSHYLASVAGHAMFEKGGSAVDAIIAANATLGVVYGHMAGLGGDLFAQVWDPGTGKVAALNASGFSGEKATIDFYREKGLDAIHQRGPLAAITVRAWSMAGGSFISVMGNWTGKSCSSPPFTMRRASPFPRNFKLSSPNMLKL